MTYRDDPLTRPACPRCASSVEVTRDRVRPWLCGACWTSFHGTPGEWAAMAGERADWLNQHGDKD